MPTLKQILWIGSAICCGNGLAIQVHLWAWELRQHRLKVFCIVGNFCLAIVLFCLWGLWSSAGNEGFLDNVAQSEQRRQIGFFAAALVSGSAFIGLLHSFQLSCRLRDAISALYGEILLALVAGCIALFLRDIFLGFPYWNLAEQNQWLIWFLYSYGISLFCLALFRPFLLKIYAQLLQMRRDWFRLK